MRHWLESTTSSWIMPIVVIVLFLVGAVILLKLGELFASIREPYRSIVIALFVLTAGGLVWNYPVSDEEMRKVQEALCRLDPVFGLSGWDCP